jgi:uncharacterized protein (DUF1697 family)
MNAKMPVLKACFEAAGFTHVRTVLSSGNVAFDTALSDESEIEEIAEATMAKHLGRSFHTIVRPSPFLAELLKSDPYAAHGIPAHAKRVVTFMRDARQPKLALPLAQDQASVFLVTGREAFTAYVPTDKGVVFMRLIERAFGKDVTTRTVETIAKCVLA